MPKKSLLFNITNITCITASDLQKFFLMNSEYPVKHFSAHTKAIHVKIMKVTGQPYFEEKKVSSHLIIVFD